jgi:hypothetical protein
MVAKAESLTAPQDTESKKKTNMPLQNFLSALISAV